ncbi:trehalose-phosphatase [Corynebacterium guangdongense]|uniref:Trehalose 6-phosphate phosphatase n=1 Tax=Corynebacterium guangdongense TaxID=1783348 RepID=A0ABU1ZZ88_9CORY|nr:trehalose-phosphatase [Corynebacterium guangdongense]MDR7330256.1 trehalose 6-phosphate phosphatase [Corynebacterium guangdongense]WJZ18814.1 Trehalose-6-phosphate phosphatase [Corynebacterium guangdongense]
MQLARTDRLLIVADFDGTLAGIVPDPSKVPVNLAACEVLDRLAQLPDTTVAVLSGRGLEDLKSVCPLRAPVTLAGSHGAEGEHGVELTGDMRARLDLVGARLGALGIEGAYVEEKPFQRVFHVAPLADADPAAAEAALAAARAVDPAGTTVAGGKNIVEFSAARVTKGDWIAAKRAQVGATATVFIGDDVTDENGFAALGPGDLGVKVGPGETLATRRVEFGAGVTDFLQELFTARAAR